MLKDCSMKTFISYSKDRPAVEFMRREVVHSFHNINSGNVKLGNKIIIILKSSIKAIT